MDLNIEWEWDSGSVEPTFQMIFAPCAVQTASTSVAKDVRFGEQKEYQSAVVMLLDIVEFTKACSELSAVEVVPSTSTKAKSELTMRFRRCSNG